MATTFNGVLQTEKNTGGILGGASTRPAGGLDNARLKVSIDSYVIGGSLEVTGSLIALWGLLPTGANILEIDLSVSAAQASATFSVGDSNSATRYASASTGLQTALPTITKIGASNYVIGTNTGDNQILLTTGGATLTAGTLFGVVYYTTD